MIENVKIETTHPDFEDYWMSVHIAGRDPFQDAVPCWQQVMCTCSCPIGTEHSVYCPAYGN